MLRGKFAWHEEDTTVHFQAADSMYPKIVLWQSFPDVYSFQPSITTDVISGLLSRLGELISPVGRSALLLDSCNYTGSQIRIICRSNTDIDWQGPLT